MTEDEWQTSLDLGKLGNALKNASSFSVFKEKLKYSENLVRSLKHFPTLGNPKMFAIHLLRSGVFFKVFGNHMHISKHFPTFPNVCHP